MPNYYTPTSDEFHKGFKCEIYTEQNIYENYVCDVDYNTPAFRVKYLDIDDIKELGFTVKGEQPDHTVLYKNIFNNQPFYYIIIFREEDGLPFIEIQDMYNHPIMAKVHIKNKHELQWLLNRYGIL